jgi:hypothetical protein
MELVEDWIANAYEGMSRRQLLARMNAVGLGLPGFAVASSSVAGEVITTSTTGITAREGKVLSGDFEIPTYEAYLKGEGKYPILIVIPEIFGMHEHCGWLKPRAAPVSSDGIRKACESILINRR